MRKYFNVLKSFWLTAFAVQMEYQFNIFIEVIAMIASLTGSIFVLSLFFVQGGELGGWTWEEALIIQGIYTCLDGITNTWLRPNLGALVNYVREGTLDFVLLKPIDSQFYLSLRTLSPSGLPEIGLGLFLVFWAISKIGLTINFQTLVLSWVMLFVAILILYSIWFLISATTIWFVKTWNATEVLRAALASGRFPITAYPPTLRILFTVILPVAFLTTVPAEVILGQTSILTLGLGIFFAFFAFTLSRLFWSFALRYYTSASS